MGTRGPKGFGLSLRESLGAFPLDNVPRPLFLESEWAGKGKGHKKFLAAYE